MTNTSELNLLQHHHHQAVLIAHISLTSRAIRPYNPLLRAGFLDRTQCPSSMFVVLPDLESSVSLMNSAQCKCGNITSAMHLRPHNHQTPGVIFFSRSIQNARVRDKEEKHQNKRLYQCCPIEGLGCVTLRNEIP